ncbi:transcriptional regulator of heat shock response [Peptoniphilus olsenii]|uniref:Transcriptional regulator of heat shock response n=1 Tax=Peptoniphilus olsenii TaxID=411570 RepID=A0ABV2J8L6_9FIRM
MKLYELTEIYNNLLDIDLNDDDLKSALSNIDDEIEIKADNIAKVLKNMDADIVALKAEEDRLKNKRKSIVNRSKDLKEYLQKQMELIDKKKFKTTLFSFSIAKNRASIDIIDESKIPEDYFNVTRTPMKSDLLEAYQNGVLTEGLELVQTESLRIR